MRIHKISLLGAVAGGLMLATPGDAATLLFNLSGPSTAIFELDFDPVLPDASTSGSFFQTITFNNVSGTFNGMLGTASNIRFDNKLGPALVINGSSLGIASFQGPDLFTGSGASAVFNQGTFNLTSATLGGNFRISIMPAAVSAVPEPATWAMMLVGFGAIGYSLRSARRRTKVGYAAA